MNSFLSISFCFVAQKKHLIETFLSSTHSICSLKNRTNNYLKSTLTLIEVSMVRDRFQNRNIFRGQGKVREFHFQSGKFKKNEKKSGNFKIFRKGCY